MRALTVPALLAIPALAAEGEKAEKGQSGLSPDLEYWLLWANFAILAIGLYILIKKFGAPYFTERRARIDREIVEATRIRQDSEARSAEVDRRLANLEADLAGLRTESKKELESLERTVSAKSTAEISRIQASAEQEIAAAGKNARLELKRYSAELAVQLAGEKIRARMTPDAQNALVSDFVKSLDGRTSAQAN
jgi:F-type H+-transporting ATPase subunit b